MSNDFEVWVQQFFTSEELEELYRVENGVSVAPKDLFAKYNRLEQIYRTGELHLQGTIIPRLILGNKYAELNAKGQVVLVNGCIAVLREDQVYLVSKELDLSDITPFA